jgi:hypothetical protein
MMALRMVAVEVRPADRSSSALEHDPESMPSGYDRMGVQAVFRKDHAQSKT